MALLGSAFACTLIETEVMVDLKIALEVEALHIFDYLIALSRWRIVSEV